MLTKLEAVNLWLFDAAILIALIVGLFIVMDWAAGKILESLGFKEAVLDFFWHRKRFKVWMKTVWNKPKTEQPEETEHGR